MIQTEINKETLFFNNTSDHLDLIGHSIQKQHNAHSFHMHMEHPQDRSHVRPKKKKNLNKFKYMEIISNNFNKQNTVKLENN